MYRITLGNTTIYDARLPECFLGNPQLTQKKNKIGSLSFTIYPTHAQYGQLVKLSSIVSVHKEGQSLPIWRGRVLSTKVHTDLSMDVECEDLLGYLLDTVMRPFDFSGDVPDFLGYILMQHNEYATAAQRINLGTVTVTDPNGYIHRSSKDYLSTWEAIETRLIKTLGGCLRLRHTSDGMYLDYLAGTQEDFKTSTQVIEYGENISELIEEVSAEATYTACIPLGAELTLEDDTGEDIKKRLTVESVNDGADYIVNEEAFAQYGWICAPVKETTWDDVTLPENLLTKARAYLNNQGVKLKNTLTITAHDRHNIDVSVESYDFLDFVQVQSTPHNISKTYLLSEKKTPLADPSGATITLGDSELSLTDTALSGFKDAQEKIENVSGTVDLNNAQTNAQLSELAQTALDLYSHIERTAKELILQMSTTYTSTSSFEEYREYVSSQLVASAQAYELQFSKVISQINALDEDTKQQLSTISKYIRFDMGDIILGRSDSALTLKIQSDRIAFILDNTEIAYFSSGRLYVDNLEAITTLTVGRFAWIPRANGNLSLKMIRPAESRAFAVWNVRSALVWEDLGDDEADTTSKLGTAILGKMKLGEGT